MQPHSKTEPYGNRNTWRSAPARVEKWQCTTSVYDTMDTLSPSLAGGERGTGEGSDLGQGSEKESLWFGEG